MVKTASPVEISWKSIDKPRIGYNGYVGFQPGKQEIFKKGHVNKGWDDKPGKPLKCDIICDHDVLITVRDGTKLYGDIYRPAHQQGKIPCILWVSFGLPSIIDKVTSEHSTRKVMVLLRQETLRTYSDAQGSMVSWSWTMRQ